MAVRRRRHLRSACQHSPEGDGVAGQRVCGRAAAARSRQRAVRATHSSDSRQPRRAWRRRALGCPGQRAPDRERRRRWRRGAAGPVARRARAATSRTTSHILKMGTCATWRDEMARRQICSAKSWRGAGSISRRYRLRGRAQTFCRSAFMWFGSRGPRDEGGADCRPRARVERNG